ncbi:sensor histidine kinase, partial [Turicimonas muris]
NLAINQIITEVDKAAEIVNHVRAYAKNLPTRREFVDLNEVASASFQTFLSATNFKGTTDLILFPRPVIVEISVWEIEIVLLNLLKNAAEALSQVSGGKIKMKINCKGNTAQVFVEDNGVVADEELIQRIFKPLFSTKKNGLGLGLAIAERIAESHGGRLSARPNNEKGLIFELCLPISKNPSNN